MTDSTKLNVLADMLLATLEEEAQSIKIADFDKLAHYTERKSSLTAKLTAALPDENEIILPALRKKLKRIEVRAGASAQLIEALHRGVMDANQRIDALQYEDEVETGIYNEQGKSVDEAMPLASVSRNF